MLETRKSNPNKPVRVLIYGVEGVGKTTLGARADRPVFITPEGGTDNIPGVDEMPNITDWKSVRAAINKLLTEEHSFKTLVIDSADWLEKLCHADIIGSSGKDIIRANGGYGAGYRESEIRHRDLIADLSKLRDARNMNIVVTAHYQVKTVKDPEMLEDYDGFEIKCHDMVSSLWREWVDALLFARFRAFLKKSDDSAKARALGDDSRVVYTVKRPAFQAKNRFGLPPEMEFTENFWNEFMGYARKGPVQAGIVEEIKADIKELFGKLKDEATQKVVVESIQKAGTDVKMLEAIRRRLKEIVG